jgi:hypothetical protein
MRLLTWYSRQRYCCGGLRPVSNAVREGEHKEWYENGYNVKPFSANLSAKGIINGATKRTALFQNPYHLINTKLH